MTSLARSSQLQVRTAPKVRQTSATLTVTCLPLLVHRNVTHAWRTCPNEHSNHGFGLQVNTGGRARDVSVVTSHALMTGHNQWMMAERFVDVGHWSVWLYFVQADART